MSCGSRGRDPCLLFQGQINVAKRRVVMASLYLGTGPLEQELVRFEVPGGWGRAACRPWQEGHGRRATAGGPLWGCSPALRAMPGALRLRPAARVRVARGLRMVFAFSNDWKKIKRKRMFVTQGEHVKFGFLCL